MRWLSVLIITGVMVLGAVLRYWNINQSFWWDELWSTLPYAAAPTIRTLFCELGYYFNNHVMYSLLCRFSMGLFGESEFSARMPALVLGLITLWVLFRFSKRYVGAWSGLAAALLLAMSAFHIDHSTEARGYTGLALFSLLATYSFFQAIRTNKLRDWGFHILCVVIGFYFHTFMIAVSVSHFCCALIFFAGKLLKINSISIGFAVFRNYLLSQVVAVIATILLYVPLLDDFFRNMQKVRMVVVDRTPFLLSLINMIFPGILTVHGAIVYGILLVSGMLFIFKKDKRLCLFIITTMVLPIILFLSLNPMFVFERYFIYALPFALLVLGCGICQIVRLVRAKPVFRILFIFLIVADLAVLQFPLIKEMNLKDRQNYREAVHYVEYMKSNDSKQTYVFALGYAGVHFNYYAKEPVYIPATYEEFKDRIKGKKYLWCLLTGWLPELRPPYEDVELYKEEPEHVKIYDYVQKHFEVSKTYSDIYLTKVYFCRKD
jgi:mannosyltransferase